MKGLVIFLVGLLVVTSVSIGAYNIITDSNNKPMPIYDLLKGFSNLNLGFDITNDTYNRMIEHLNRFKDDSYKYTQDYREGSALYRLWKDWYNNSFISYLLVGISDLLYLVLSTIIDSVVMVIKVIIFARGVLFGVPST